MPPREIQQLRDLTRYRVKLKEERTRFHTGKVIDARQNFNFPSFLAALRTHSSPLIPLSLLCVWRELDRSVFSLVNGLPSTSTASALTPLFGCFAGVGSEEARRESLASVRRSNCTDGFPVYSFHVDALAREVIEGIKPIKFTNPYSP